jgi:hypothetical protein
VPGGWFLGLVFVLLGTLHFVERGHAPAERSTYLGGTRPGYWTRVAFALVELAFGFAVLLAAV